MDRQQLLNDGYIILRDLVAPEQMERLRERVETMIERRKVLSVARRKPDEPPGGAWEASAQPRLKFDEDFDETTIEAIQFCLQENTFGVSQRLMEAPKVAVTYMACMCSPEHDHGPANWHRDVSPPLLAPLRGLQMNTLHYGPTYLQWNIALYDDSVFWIVPGSHRRVANEAEDRQLADNPRVPLPGSMPVELRAGDGVVYTHLLFHWGSNYTRKLRRTIHLGYRSVGNPWFAIVHWRHWEPEFIPRLPAPMREPFETFNRLYDDEFDLIASIFRAVIDHDGAAFEERLSRLHPGDTGRMVTVVMLSKLALKLQQFKQLDIESLPPDERAKKVSAHWPCIHDFDRLTSRFSRPEANLLWQRFKPLDDRLKLDAAQDGHGFQTGQTPYNLNDMPAGFEVEDFMASWEG